MQREEQTASTPEGVMVGPGRCDAAEAGARRQDPQPDTHSQPRRLIMSFVWSQTDRERELAEERELRKAREEEEQRRKDDEE